MSSQETLSGVTFKLVDILDDNSEKEVGRYFAQEVMALDGYFLTDIRIAVANKVSILKHNIDGIFNETIDKYNKCLKLIDKLIEIVKQKFIN